MLFRSAVAFASLAAIALSNPAPATDMPKPKAEMKSVLDALAALGPKPIGEMRE